MMARMIDGRQPTDKRDRARTPAWTCDPPRSSSPDTPAPKDPQAARAGGVPQTPRATSVTRTGRRVLRAPSSTVTVRADASYVAATLRVPMRTLAGLA